MNKGDSITYKPINWANGDPKVNDPTYGKKGIITWIRGGVCTIKVDGEDRFCYTREIERG